MKTKYLLAAAWIAASAASVTASAAPFGNFQNLATSGAIKPFALDFGGVLGGAAFHSARALGFPGFDIGVVGTMQFRPDKNDVILRNSGVHGFGIPLIQAEIGLPYNVDVIAHGITYAGARIFGGGVRYGVYKSGILSPLPDVSISAFGDKMNQTYFSITHYSLNAVASYELPVVHPFLGIGWDSTKMTVGTSLVPGVSGLSATASGTRLSGGIDLSPIPFGHIYAAFTLLHGIPGADLGLGVRF